MAISTIVSRSPASRRFSFWGVMSRGTLTDSGVMATGGSSPNASVVSTRVTTVLGRCGSRSQMSLTISSKERPSNRYGRWPVSSSYSSTPSEYTSLAVVIGWLRTCSGLA